MTTLTELVRCAEEQLRAEFDVAVGLTAAVTAECAEQATDQQRAAAALRALTRRSRALDGARLRVQRLEGAVRHYTEVMPFLSDGWEAQRALIAQAFAEDPLDGLASWLDYWFAAAGSRRIDALLRLQSAIPLPSAASVLAERMEVATRALTERDWLRCHQVLEIGAAGVTVGARRVPGRVFPQDREPGSTVRENLRLLTVRLALHDGRVDRADAVLDPAGHGAPTAPRLALRSRSLRLRGAEEEAEALLKEARDLEPHDPDVAVESIVRARAAGDLDTALDHARSAVEGLLSLTDVESDLGRLIAPPAELWLAAAERAWSEGDRDGAARFADRTAITAAPDDYELHAAVGEIRSRAARSQAESREALLFAGEQRTAAGQLEHARRDYEAAGAGTAADETEARVQAGAQLRWADVVCAIARQRPYRDFADQLTAVLARLRAAQAHVDVDLAESWSYLTESDLCKQLSRSADTKDRDSLEWAALRAAARAVALNPSWSLPWLTLAGAATTCDLYRVADRSAELAFRIEPGEAALTARVRALVSLGLYEPALDLLGAGSDPWRRCVRGHVALMLGQADQALDHFAGVTIGRNWSWAWRSSVCALAVIGDLASARARSEEFMSAVADRAGERAWLRAAAFDALVHQRLDAAERYADRLCEGAGPRAAKSRRIKGQILLLSADPAGWHLIREGLADDPLPAAMDVWERQERPVLEALARERGVKLSSRHLHRSTRRSRTRLGTEDPFEELRQAAAHATVESAGTAELAEAALRVAVGFDDDRSAELLQRLSDEFGLSAEAESLRRHRPESRAEGTPSAEPSSSEATDAPPDHRPQLRLRVPTSWAAELCGAGYEDQLFMYRLPALCNEAAGAAAESSLIASDELEPDGYQIYVDDLLVAAGRADPASRYCPADALTLLPEQASADPSVVATDQGVAVPVAALDQHSDLSALVTLSAAEAIAEQCADIARENGIVLAPPTRATRPRSQHAPGGDGGGVAAGLPNVNALAHWRWELRGRPEGSGADAAADWRAAERLRHQLVAQVAYFRWIDRGRPFGDPLTDWFAAEAELAVGRTGEGRSVAASIGDQLSHQIIEEAAYFHWIERGRPDGSAWADWSASETVAEVR